MKHLSPFVAIKRIYDLDFSSSKTFDVRVPHFLLLKFTGIKSEMLDVQGQ